MDKLDKGEPTAEKGAKGVLIVLPGDGGREVRFDVVSASNLTPEERTRVAKSIFKHRAYVMKNGAWREIPEAWVRKDGAWRRVEAPATARTNAADRPG